MLCRIEIQMDNAAFADEVFEPELARILRLCVEWAEDGVEVGNSLRLRDVNGNTVGRAEVEA